MQCRICHNELPPNVAFCPECGSPVASSSGSQPYQGMTPGAGSSPSQPGIAPTMLASSPGQGVPASYPTPPPPGALPYTPASYGEGTPPPPVNPYGTPLPSTNYGESAPPPPVNPYTAPPQPYGAPQQPYGAPQQGQYGAPPVYMPPQQQPKRKNGCIIALVIVLVIFVLAVGGVIAAVAYVGHQAGNVVATANAQATADQATSTSSNGTTPTATTGSSSGVPDSSQIDATAAANITGAQTSGSVDSNYKPTDPKTSFNSGDTVNITFTLAGHAGYAMTKIYRDGQFDVQSDSPLAVKSGVPNGVFPFTPSHTGQFVAGLYWCTQSDCSDAALAQVVNFTVS